VTETMIWIYWGNDLESAIRKPQIQIVLWPWLGPEFVLGFRSYKTFFHISFFWN